MNTPFKDAIVPTPGASDADACQRGGTTFDGSMSETAGTLGTAPTFVDCGDGPKPGQSQLDAAAKTLGSQTSRTSPDLSK